MRMDDLEVERLLGEGELGTVSVVRERRTTKRFALKRLRGDDPGAADRLRAEFETLAGLSHPNLVAVHALLEEDDVLGFTMELIDGTDWLGWMREDAVREDAPRRPTLPMAFGQPLQEDGLSAYVPCGPAGHARLRACLPQLASAVEAIHAAHLLHGDLKPDNVRITPGGRLVVLDFGIAAGLSTDRRRGLIGTAPYLAPELGEGRPPAPATDWYAVGVLLFEALTGQRPFDGAGEDVFVRKRTVSAPAPSELVSEVPADLERLCLSLLETAPHSRGDGATIRGALGSAAQVDGPLS